MAQIYLVLTDCQRIRATLNCQLLTRVFSEVKSRWISVLKSATSGLWKEVMFKDNKQLQNKSKIVGKPIQLHKE